MLETVNELSRIVESFRDRFRLSKATAAKVLGVSVGYVRSLETGVDVSTGLSFKPREATLRQLAAKMSEFGYPVSYEDLMIAAGHVTPAQVTFYEGKTPVPNDEELRRGELRIPDLTDIAASSDARWDELTDDERRMVYEALAVAAKGLIGSALAGRRQRKIKGP